MGASLGGKFDLGGGWEPLWRRAGALWSYLGASCSLLGADWGRSGASCQRLDAVLGAFWNVLNVLEAYWSHLGGIFRPSRKRFGTVLGGSLGRLGPS